VANLQVKDVPDELHVQLRNCAARRGKTIRDIVLGAVRHELDHESFLARLETRSTVELGVPITDLLRDEREERDRRL